jgi:hypothetical protein
VTTATDTQAVIDELLEAVFSIRSVLRLYNEDQRDKAVGQRLQNRVLPATGNPDKRTPVREMHVAFKIPYVYNYITKLCKTQAEVILNHRNPTVRGIEQGEAVHREYKRLKFGGGQAHDRSAD